jgi:hypothetical protein
MSNTWSPTAILLEGLSVRVETTHPLGCWWPREATISFPTLHVATIVTRKDTSSFMRFVLVKNDLVDSFMLYWIVGNDPMTTVNSATHGVSS